jgi:hypothetical protein
LFPSLVCHSACQLFANGGQVDPQPGNHDVDELANHAFLQQRCVRAAIVLRGRKCKESIEEQPCLSLPCDRLPQTHGQLCQEPRKNRKLSVRICTYTAATVRRTEPGRTGHDVSRRGRAEVYGRTLAASLYCTCLTRSFCIAFLKSFSQSSANRHLS